MSANDPDTGYGNPPNALISQGFFRQPTRQAEGPTQHRHGIETSFGSRLLFPRTEFAR